METNPIKKASAIVGSRIALAKALGVSKGAVWQWEHQRKVPAEHCPSIERLTAGAVRCEDMRDDIDWAAIRGAKTKRSPSVAASLPVR